MRAFVDQALDVRRLVHVVAVLLPQLAEGLDADRQSAFRHLLILPRRAAPRNPRAPGAGRPWPAGAAVDTEDGGRIRSPPGLMADERAAEQADGGTAETAETAETAVSQPHDKYFQHVFSNEQDAASLLRTCVPNALADTLKWSTLSLLRGSLRG